MDGGKSQSAEREVADASSLDRSIREPGAHGNKSHPSLFDDKSFVPYVVVSCPSRSAPEPYH